MTVFEYLDEKWAEEPFVLTPAEYQGLCRAVNALPDAEQPVWDDCVLNFNYNGKTFAVVSPEATV